VYWSDLEVAKESREMWMGLMTDADAGRTPEVGVFVEDEQLAVPVVQVNEPLVGKGGLPVKITFFDCIASTWICKDPTCPPPTYKVRSYLLRFTLRECLKITNSLLGMS